MESHAVGRESGLGDVGLGDVARRLDQRDEGEIGKDHMTDVLLITLEK